MTTRDFAQLVLDQVPYDPTDQQIELIAALARFCSSATPHDTVFLLNGYAGTGKTSLCAALVRALNGVGIGTVLLAPTGRAAKVFSSFATHPAYTIHRRIYSSAGNGITSDRSMAVAENRSHNTVFIVDEASMIGGDMATSNLLEDLVHYVYSGINCRMILLGDTAQLPPVGCEDSPAMNPDNLRAMGLRVVRATLTATVRQTADSGILYNATWLRRAMRQSELPLPRLVASRFPDIEVVPGEELEDRLSRSYAETGLLNTILVTRSNRRATDFNAAVRSSILYCEEEITRDDIILVAKNNYFWSREVKGLDFLANGDMAVVEQVYGTELRYGLRFADVALHMPARDVTFDAKIILDSLYIEEASMGRQRMLDLFNAIVSDPDDNETSDATRAANALKSPYFNALQVKFGYAVTCHKAQGGQWADVFVDLSYIPPEAMGMEFYRWLYTAITRATSRLCLIDPTLPVK
ncbi:MAG: AAA family ATPase [Muribaculum sp.]|nr:AAA family ATPase [Muribaculum sp.]